ncbi:hypothetical protein [Methanobacterium bryantii]|nr:hypothetical protein [Methanobacterium bryantii]
MPGLIKKIRQNDSSAARKIEADKNKVFVAHEHEMFGAEEM